MCGKKQLRALQRRHAWRTFGENGSFDTSIVVTCKFVTQKCKQVSIYRNISFLYFKRNSCRWQLIRGPNKSGTYFVYPSYVLTSFECAAARLKSELTCNRLEPEKFPDTTWNSTRFPQVSILFPERLLLLHCHKKVAQQEHCSCSLARLYCWTNAFRVISEKKVTKEIKGPLNVTGLLMMPDKELWQGLHLYVVGNRVIRKKCLTWLYIDASILMRATSCLVSLQHTHR